MIRWGLAPILILAVSLLAGCVSAPQREANASVRLGSGEQVQIAGSWLRLLEGLDSRRAAGVRFTRYGERLDLLWLVSGVRADERLVDSSAMTEAGPERPGDLTDASLAEFIAGSFAAMDCHGAVLTPHTGFVSADDWSPPVSIECFSARGLAYRGALRHRMRNGRLALALWLAEAEIYAPLIEADAGAVLDQL